MKELDFDELDKAVNSLVSRAKPKLKSVSASVTPTESKAAKQNTEAKSQAVPVTVSPGRHTSRLGVQSAKPQPSKGSFIDVMTVKPKVKSASPPLKTNRQGATIQPPKDASLKTPVEAKQVSEALEQKSLVDTLPEEPKKKEEKLQLPARKEPESSKERAAEGNEKWPDPLDFHANDSEVSEGTKKEELTSPFLPDTKVEKRPLGTFGVSQPAIVEEENKKGGEESAKKMQEVAKSLAASVPEPVVSVEAPKEEAETAEEKPETSEVEVTETAEKQVRESALLSIPQQYKRTAQETNEATRPVFDTKEYHQPLLEATTHGHRSPWRALLVLVLVALLAAVAYWAFTYFK